MSLSIFGKSLEERIQEAGQILVGAGSNPLTKKEVDKLLSLLGDAKLTTEQKQKLHEKGGKNILALFSARGAAGDRYSAYLFALNVSDAQAKQ